MSCETKLQHKDMLVRRATAADAADCGRIIHHAFQSVALRHGFKPDFPSVSAGIELARSLIASPNVYGVVAETRGTIVGSNFLDEGDEIRGVGPITVDPQLHGGGVGRLLMEAAMERARGAAGVRLLQDSFNMISISLYAALGFEVREPMLVMTGRPSGANRQVIRVRPMTEQDAESCNALCVAVHGFARTSQVADALRLHSPLVCERGGRVTGYLTAPTFWFANHGVAETDDDMRALLQGAAEIRPEPLSFLLPIRQAELFRWCLDQGLRAAKPMTLMSVGEYREPSGTYLPSVFY